VWNSTRKHNSKERKLEFLFTGGFIRISIPSTLRR
jgi:hypothetical protein